MKIISVNVQSFGKLKNVNFDFSDSVTVLRNNNGFGKTTLANFIRAMFYGFAKTKSTSERMNDAARYIPWNSNERYGGSMIVEHNGEQYRIERFFGKTAKQETLSVTNVKNGKPLVLETSLGVYFLGLTMESYDRSAYFPQESLELTANENFDSKLANLVQDGVEDLDKVQKKLADYKRYYKHKIGSGGRVNELGAELQSWERQLYNANLAENRAKQIDARLVQIDEEQARITKEQRKVRDSLNDLHKQLALAEPSEEEKKAKQKLAELNDKLARIPVEFDEDKKRCDDLDKQIANLRGDVKAKVYPYLPLLITAIILMVAGFASAIVCAVLSRFIAIIFGAVAVVAGVVLWVVSYRRNGAKTLVSGEYDALVSQYYAIAAKYIYVTDLEFNDVRRAFWQAYSDYLGDVRVRDELSATLSTQSANFDIAEKVEQAQAEEEKISVALVGLSQEKGQLVAERSAQNIDKAAIQDKILALKNDIASMEYKYRIAAIVENLLAQAKDNLSTSYLPRLCARCQELLTLVTECSYQVVIDREFSVSLRENGQTKPMSEFSRGIREITLLCFRLALSELLFDGQIPFVIIDDAFVNYDEENFVRATDLLAKLSAQTQIIYFTCHKRLGSLLKK